MSQTRIDPAQAELRVLESIDQFDPTEWDSLSTDVCRSHGWQRAAEEYFSATRFRYFCAYTDGHLRAALCAYDRHGPHPPTTITRLAASSNATLSRFRSRVLRHTPLRCLITGSPHAYASDAIGDPIFDQHLIGGMERYAREQGYDVISFLFHRRPVQLAGSLSGPCVTDYELQLPGSSPEDYIRTFRRKHRYVRKKEVLKAGPVVWSPLADHGEAMAKLRRLTAHRHGNRNDVPGAYYETLARHLGDTARIAHSADWNAALCVLVGRDTLTMLHVGTRGRDVRHFDVTYTAPLKLAYELGLGTIIGRPSSDQTKLLRGYRPVQTHYCIKPISRRAKMLLGALGALRGTRDERRRGGG